MGYIRKNNGKKGTTYTARVRLKQGGAIVHEEHKTFDKRADAKVWISRREALLAEPGALDERPRVTIGELIDLYIEHCQGADWGLTKKADLLHLKKKAIAEIPAYDLTAQQLVEHVKLRRQAGAGPSTVNNDLVWLGVIFKTARPAWGYDLDLQTIEDAKVVCRQARLIGRAKQRNRRPTIQELDQLLAYFEAADGRATIPMVELVLFQLFSGRRDGVTARLAACAGMICRGAVYWSET